MVRRFADERLVGRAAEMDQQGCFPADTVLEMGELGLFGLTIPEQFDGLSATRVQSTLVLEQLARVDASAALTLMAHMHSTGLIARYGSEDQKERWLLPAATGRRLAAVALTEPDAGTDIASVRARAERDGEDYRLTANKTFITNGDRAELFVVFAGVLGQDDISTFIVDGRAEGVSAGRPFRKMGLRSSTTTEVTFDRVWVPGRDRLGEEGQGRAMAMESLNGARMSTAAQAVGIAQGAFDIAFQYAGQRVQSGKVIGQHQAVQLRLADMHILIQAARALLYQAARQIDAGDAGAPTHAAAAKVFCTSTASEVTSRAVELVGGVGYVEDMPLARYMRDAKGGEIYDGTNDVNRLLIARQLLRTA